MKIGYTQVSTNDQNLDLQIEALEKAGCEKNYQEKISGATKNSPELDKMIEQFREGDELFVWRLDRLGRSLKHIINLVLSLSDKGIIIKGITDGVDTSTIKETTKNLIYPEQLEWIFYTLLNTINTYTKLKKR